MARLPGNYASTIFALRCPALGKYVIAHARACQLNNSDHAIWSVQVTDRPLSVARRLETARSLRDLIFRNIGRLITEQQHNISELQQRINDLANNKRFRDIYVDYYQEHLSDLNTHLGVLQTLAVSAIDVVSVTSETLVTEQVMV